MRLLHDWLDSWRRIGDVVRGMTRQGWDVPLTEYDAEHWRATFFVASHAHSIVGGSAWETTAWRAVERAACAALAKLAHAEATPRDWPLADESPS